MPRALTYQNRNQTEDHLMKNILKIIAVPALTTFLSGGAMAACTGTGRIKLATTAIQGIATTFSDMGIPLK